MGRFDSHLKKNLLHIHKNIYLSKSDEQYHEKILRYHDPSSPEAHYLLGQKMEEKGLLVKAYKHYQEAANIYSPYYFKAKQACRLLEDQITGDMGQVQKPAKAFLPFYAKVILCTLLIINVCLLILLFLFPSFSSTISSSLKMWNTGTDVVYETEDLPYVMYFPANTPKDKIEKSLHDQSIRLGRDVKNKNILIYGVSTTDSKLSFEVLPLKSRSIEESSFVKAEYNSALSEPVKIRFLNNGKEAFSVDPSPLSFIGANVVRTALQSYMKDKGMPPERLNQLVADYPDNYLSFIPNEATTGSNSVSSSFTGSGGWVYNHEAAAMADMFYPNTPDSSPIPFNPVQVDIDKQTFSLIVKTPPYIISSHSIGIGKNDSTPIGRFPIRNRVLEPLGEHPGMFGTAALGMGDIAIHGTFDEASIENAMSHGCIRLTNPDIKEIYDLVPKGAVVTISDSNAEHKLKPVKQNLDQLIPHSGSGNNQTSGTIFTWAD
ncbi:L,D-transpeptidase [Rossellomorea aquimaris]|uniref:L,D-transpeptidase n=1 Tax=Rossellomorea aquimaris TaxID=189382 RepID=UPI001CD50904|nr:L,D-transpeptidase [Rossellomorea aquimaris]MCA1061076.1 L,D-transpeptidase [Rossellomorea aquimaris]